MRRLTDSLDWASSARPDDMPGRVADRATMRQLWLFAGACLRRVWHLLPKGSRKVTRAVEGWADLPPVASSAEEIGNKRLVIDASRESRREIEVPYLEHK